MSKYAIGLIAFVVIIATGFFALEKYLYNLGVQSERTKQLTKAVKLVKERDKLDKKVKSATPADVCRVLGGQWVPDNGGECS